MAKKLYGTDPDQVPTNADLGTLAYQDKDNASISKIDAPDDGEMLINSRNSNGDVIIGNTVVNPTSGYSAQKGIGYDGSTGTVEIATNANQAAMQIGKNNTNGGDLVVFRKQSTVVGNISTAYNGSGSYLSIGTDDVNLYFFDDANPAVLPRKDNDGVSDGYVDLGNTGNRFKRLYLADNIIMANGAGIDFSATGDGSGTMTSELLADYEEGTWTPVYSGSSVSGTGTYTRQGGVYVKVGDLVYASCTIGISAHTGSGNAEVTGLPYAAMNSVGNYAGITVSFNSGHAHTSGYQIIGFIQVNTAGIKLWETGGTGSQNPLALDTSFSEFDFSIVYRAT